MSSSSLNVHASPVAVLVSVRIDPVSGRATRSRADAAGAALALQALQARATLQGTVAPELTDQLWQRTLGNPLFARELVLQARDTGTIVVSDGAWRLAGDFVAPESLGDLVEARANARWSLDFVHDHSRLQHVVNVYSCDSISYYLDFSTQYLQTYRFDKCHSVLFKLHV